MPAPEDTLPADIGLRQLRTKVHGRLFGSNVEPVRIGRYEVSEYLGSGGMGVVYAARDPELDRAVAIKLLRADGIKETARARLRREAKALAKLSHPNVVHVYEVGSDRGQVYVAMEYVEGETLAQWLEDGAHDTDAVLEMFTNIGHGLAAAHDVGLVHRDFKPDNVLIDGDGRPRVLDFGLVISADDHAATRPDPDPNAEVQREAPLSLTKTGTLVGTPAYMAPEQHRGETADLRADVFAYCVALFEGLYGVRPFGGDSYEVLAASVLRGHTVTPTPDKFARVPKRIRDVVARGLEVDPNDRFATMHELLVALQQPARRRHPAWWGIGAGVVAGAFVLGAVMRPEPEPAPEASAATGEVCEAATAKLAGTWDEQARTSIGAAFVATAQPFAPEAFAQVKANLDAWTSRWVAAWGGACERALGHDIDDAELGLRQMRCLDVRLAELSELTGVFADADPRVVTRAADASAGLADVRTCEGPKVVVPDMATDEGRAVVLKLARAAGRLESGQRTEAHALATQALTVAQRLRRVDLQARAKLLIARAASPDADPAEVLRALNAVTTLAREAGDAHIEAEAWIEMIGRVTDRVAGPEGEAAAALARLAPAWADTAQWLLESVHDPRLELALHSRLAELYREQGAFESARERVALAEKAYVAGRSSGTRDAVALDTLRGRIAASAGEDDEAATYFLKAKTKLEKRLGRGHPDAVRAAYRLASVTKNRTEAAALANEVFAQAVAGRAVDAEYDVRVGEALQLMRQIKLECTGAGDCDDLFSEVELEGLLQEWTGQTKAEAQALARATKRAVKRRVRAGEASVLVIADGVTVNIDMPDVPKPPRPARAPKVPAPPKPPKPSRAKRPTSD